MPELKTLAELSEELRYAGFKGEMTNTKEQVFYPGGSYAHDFITLAANPDGTGLKLENYETHLALRYPTVLINEAVRIGVIDPRNAIEKPADPTAVLPLVDLVNNNFTQKGGVLYYASTGAGEGAPLYTRWTAPDGRNFLKVKFPSTGMFDRADGWIAL